MSKVWKSSFASSMKTEGDYDFILALPLKTVQSENGLCCVSVWLLQSECCDKIFLCGSHKEH